MLLEQNLQITDLALQLLSLGGMLGPFGRKKLDVALQIFLQTLGICGTLCRKTGLNALDRIQECALLGQLGTQLIAIVCQSSLRRSDRLHLRLGKPELCLDLAELHFVPGRVSLDLSERLLESCVDLIQLLARRGGIRQLLADIFELDLEPLGSILMVGCISFSPGGTGVCGHQASVEPLDGSGEIHRMSIEAGKSLLQSLLIALGGR